MAALSTGPVPQILWGGQMVRRGRDPQDPHGSNDCVFRLCIQALTRAAGFAVVPVVTSAGSWITSVCFILGTFSQIPETLSGGCRLSSCIQTFLISVSKKAQTKTPHAGWVVIKLLDCQCFGCIKCFSTKGFVCFHFDPECRCFQPLDNPACSCSG